MHTNDPSGTVLTEDVSRIHNICMHSNQVISPATMEETQLALKKFKLNKASDYLDITD